MSALKKILLVDDDPMIGKSFDRVLSTSKGYKVITTHNAAEALEKMREEEFDLIYTDIKMPGMSGIELAEQIKAKQPWTPIVIITGFGTQENEQRAKACGVDAFLNKPLSLDMIETSASTTYKKPILTVIHSTPKVEVVQQQLASTETTSEIKVNKPIDIALFLVAPFIGLLYALALPLIGMFFLIREAIRAFPAIKKVGLFVAAPFIGLAYALFLPIIGLGMLLYVGGKSLFSVPQLK